MALIKCPECGKEISDKASACIHCGYPLQKLPESIESNISYKVVIPTYNGASPTKIPAIGIVREITGMDIAEAKAFVEQNSTSVIVKDGLSQNQANIIMQKFKAIGVDAKVYGSTEPVAFVNPSMDKNVICCPKCGSTKYHAGARGFGLVTGFIGSGKTVLTCLKCGHRWKPGK